MAGRPRLRRGTHGAIKSKKLPSGGWESRCLFGDSDGHAREVRRRGQSRQHAEDRLQAALDERPARSAGSFNPDTRFRVLAEHWFAKLDREVSDQLRAAGTVANYRSHWKHHIEPKLGAITCRDAEDVAVINAYVVDVKGRLKPGRMTIIKAVLNGIIGHAQRLNAMSSNPMPAVERVPGGTKKAVKAMTPEQIVAWLTFLSSWKPGLGPDGKPRCRESQAHNLYEITLMMLATGARISEVLAVAVTDIDLSERTIQLDHRIVRVTGKGLLRVPRRGSKGAPVTLYLPDWAAAAARELHLRRGAKGPLFPSVTPKAHSAWRDPADVEKAILAARLDAKLDHELTSHLYRKSVATHLDRGNLPPELIAEQLTHRSIRTTKGSYIARRPLGNAAAQLLEAFAPPPDISRE